jgi:hypothetical protein
MAPIFERVVASGDRFAMHAYLTAVENANRLSLLEQELRNSPLLAAEERMLLQEALRSGSFVPEGVAAAPDLSKVPAGQ